MGLNQGLMSLSERVNGLVEKLLLVAGVTISVVLFIQVLARYFGHSLSWSEEIGRYLLVATTFLGATVAYKRAHFIGLAGFGARFGLVFEQVVLRGLQLLNLGCFGLIAWFGAIYTVNSWQQTTTAIQMPMAIPIAVVPLSAAIFLLHILADMTKSPQVNA